MGRQLITNIPRLKIIRNQYNSGDSSHKGNALQYTVPSNKIAQINLDSVSCLRSEDSYIERAVFQLVAQKTSGSGKFLSNFAIGGYENSSSNTGQMVSFRPWYNFMEGHHSTHRNTGTGTASFFGTSSSRFLEHAFSGNNNDLSSTPSDNIGNDPSMTNQNSPYGPSYNRSSICDAQKDYIVPAGTQIYFQYRVDHNTGPTQTYNQIDITLKVEEMDDYA